MKLFQIGVFFIIIKISMNYYNVTEIESNSIVYKNNLNANSGYLYYLKKLSYNEENNYFEFQLELNKNYDKSISLFFVKDNYIYSYSNPKNQTIEYSDLNIEENGENIVMKWSNSFEFTRYDLGILIVPNKNIDQISIRLYADTRVNDYIRILIFFIFFGICILLCVLTLIMTKACGSKESNSIIIGKTKSTGLVQNEIMNQPQI